MTRRGYAACQIAGWSAWAAILLLYLELAGVEITAAGVRMAVLNSGFGFAISHGYRSLVRARRWTALPLRRLAPRVLAASIAQAALLDGVAAAIDRLLPVGAYHAPAGILVIAAGSSGCPRSR
jgi:hypothetical protein